MPHGVSIEKVDDSFFAACKQELSPGNQRHAPSGGINIVIEQVLPVLRREPVLDVQCGGRHFHDAAAEVRGRRCGAVSSACHREIYAGCIGGQAAAGFPNATLTFGGAGRRLECPQLVGEVLRVEGLHKAFLRIVIAGEDVCYCYVQNAVGHQQACALNAAGHVGQRDSLSRECERHTPG